MIVVSAANLLGQITLGDTSMGEFSDDLTYFAVLSIVYVLIRFPIVEPPYQIYCVMLWQYLLHPGAWRHGIEQRGSQD